MPTSNKNLSKAVKLAEMDTRYESGKKLLKNKQYSKAITEFLNVSPRHRNSKIYLGNAYHSLALQQVRQGKINGAQDNFLKAIAQGHFQSYNNLAMLYLFAWDHYKDPKARDKVKQMYEDGLKHGVNFDTKVNHFVNNDYSSELTQCFCRLFSYIRTYTKQKTSQINPATESGTFKQQQAH